MKFIRRNGWSIAIIIILAMVVCLVSISSDKLSTNLKTANSTISTQKNDITNLNGEISKKDDIIKEKDDTIQKQADEIDSLNKTINSLKSEISKLTKKVSDLMAQLAKSLKLNEQYSAQKAEEAKQPEQANGKSSVATDNGQKATTPPKRIEPSVPYGWKTYSIDGISFSYPTNWSLSDKDKSHLVITSSYGIKVRYDSPRTITQWAWSKKGMTIDLIGIEKINNTGSSYPFYIVWTVDNVALYSQFPGTIDPMPEPMTQGVFSPVIDNGNNGKSFFGTNYPTGTTFSPEQSGDMETVKEILKSIRY